MLTLGISRLAAFLIEVIKFISILLQKSLLAVIAAVSATLMPVQPSVTHIDSVFPERVEARKITAQTLEEFIRGKARLNNLDEEKVIFIARCESQMRYGALGDSHLICQSTKKPMRSRGIWQINECGHPEVSDEQAFGPSWSTDWAMEIFKNGNESKEWKACSNKYQKFANAASIVRR
jgi:hypothetical protein